MSYEEEFDRIIRQKADDAKYSFEEGNWEKASSLIDADRRETRLLNLKKFYLPGAIFVAIGVAGFLALNYLNHSGSESSIAVVSTVTIPQSRAQSEALPQSQPQSVTKPESQSQPQLQPEPITQSQPEPQSSVLKSAITPATVEAKKEPTRPVSKEPAVSKNTEATIPELNAATGNNINDNKNISDAKENGPAAIPVPVKASEIAKEETRNEAAQQPVQTHNAEVSPAAGELNVEQLATIHSNLSFEVSDPELMPTTFNYLSRYDEDYYSKGNPKKHYLNAELGGTYLLGWSSKHDAKGFNYFGGINYGRYLCPKTSVSIGLQVYNINHIEQPFYTDSHKEYGFGSSTIYTVVTTSQLYYASVPLKFNYHINSSSLFGIGLNIGYLIAASNTVRSYRSNSEEPDQDLFKTNSHSIYDGIKTTNMMLSAHYKAQLCARMGINAEVVYGFTDIFKNMGGVNNAEKPIGFRLSLQYTLFDK